jgi:aromatic ring-cleaving dioxygenase
MSEISPATPADLDSVTGWHAHIYYDPTATRSQAERLRVQLANRFPSLQIGRWHDSPVGPHTRAMFQILFGPEDFADVVPFLAFARGGLSILVHADGTGDGRKAHLEQAMWMGEPLPLKFSPRA